MAAYHVVIPPKVLFRNWCASSRADISVISESHLIANEEEAYVHKNGAEIPDVPAGPAFGDNPTGMSKEAIAANKQAEKQSGKPPGAGE